jgi:catecholate siderophore receptor
LRSTIGPVHNQAKPAAAKKDAKTATLVTAALLTAASPISMAIAQGTLPPLSVETQAKKKAKAAPAAKSGGTASQPAEASTAPAKAANPYADPNAPYKVDTSGSGKFTEPLVNTPRTVTAVPQQVLQDKAVQSLRELARQVPGVTIGYGEGGNAFGDRFFIRGFDARGDIYVDGIRDPGNASREVFAVEQIEIYKGPASSIGGRSTVGGAINIITKKPNEYENFYNFSQMFGTDSTLRTTVDVNQVLTPWLAVRGNILYHQNEVAGRDVVEDERWGGFLSATIKPSQDFKVTLDYYRYRTDGIPDFGVPLNKVTGLPWTESGVPRSNWYGDADRDFMKNEQDVVTATVEAKLSDSAKLTNRTRYGKTVVDYIATGPEDGGNTVPGVTDPATGQEPGGLGAQIVGVAGGSARYQATTMVANQTDLTVKFDTFGLKHTAVAGIELSREEISRYGYPGINQLRVGGTFTQPLLSPDHHPGANFPSRTWTFDATVDTQAAYLLDTIQLNKQWFINGGVRFDHFERANEAPMPAPTPQNPNPADPNVSRDDDFITWNVGILFKPIPIGSIYAAYGTAVAPFGSELDANNATYGGFGAGSELLDPETATSIEIGTKWELFNRRLLATAALFQTEKENAREATVNNTVGATGAYRIRGIELGVQGSITPRWSVYGGLVLLDTEVTKSANPLLVGRDVANVPETQFTLLSKYKLTDKLTIGAQATYSAEVLAGTFAAGDLTTNLPATFRIPDHWRFDAMAEYKFSDNFSAQLNVVNLTDELYYDSLYRSGNPFVFVAPGRAGYLTLNWKY